MKLCITTDNAEIVLIENKSKTTFQIKFKLPSYEIVHIFQFPLAIPFDVYPINPFHVPNSKSYLIFGNGIVSIKNQNKCFPIANIIGKVNQNITRNEIKLYATMNQMGNPIAIINQKNPGDKT